MEWVDLWRLLELKTLMLGHGGSSAGSYLANPTSPIPSHCASIVATSTVRVKCEKKIHKMKVEGKGASYKIWSYTYVG